MGCLRTSFCEVFDVEKYRNYARGHDESLMVNTRSSYLKHLKVLFPYLKLTIRLLVKKINQERDIKVESFSLTYVVGYFWVGEAELHTPGQFGLEAGRGLLPWFLQCRAQWFRIPA